MAEPKNPKTKFLAGIFYRHYKRTMLANSFSKDLSETLFRSESMFIFLNAPTYLITPTYEGSGQAMHPSIIDFKNEYGLEQWNGYRFWMAVTPFPFGNSIFENPCILVSFDGLTWFSPPGFKNPLDIPDKPNQDHYNSDPELIYDSISNCLVLFWREYYKNRYERIWQRSIMFDLKITPKWLCIEEQGANGEDLILSPAVWRNRAGGWLLWTSNGSSVVYLYFSLDGRTWSSRQPCTAPWNNLNGGYVPWHLSVKPDYRKKRFEFFINGWPKKGKQEDSVIFYVQASIKDPVQLTMPLNPFLLSKGIDTNWDGGLLYRASFVVDHQPMGTIHHVWYSARSRLGEWHTGYTWGQLLF